MKLLPRGYYAVQSNSVECEDMFLYGRHKFTYAGETYQVVFGENLFATLEEAYARAADVPEVVLEGLDYESFTTPVILFSEGKHGIIKPVTFDKSITLLGQGAGINPSVPAENPLETPGLNPKRAAGESVLRGSFWSGEFVVKGEAVETLIIDGFSCDNLRFSDVRRQGGKASVIIRNMVHIGCCGYTLYHFDEADAGSSLDREVLLQNIRVVDFEDLDCAGNFMLMNAHKVTLDGICYDTTGQVFGFTDIAHKHANLSANFPESEYVITNSYFRNLQGENGISTSCYNAGEKKLHLTVKDSVFVNASRKDEAVLTPHMVGEGISLKIENCTFTDDRNNKCTAIQVRGDGKNVTVSNCTFQGFAGEWSNDLTVCMEGSDYIENTAEGFETSTEDPHCVIGTDHADYSALDARYEGTKAYYGDLHVHTDCGGTSDGAYPMEKWPAAMDKMKLDFAAVVDHRQMRGFFLPEWDETRFIIGTEPGAWFLDTKACRCGLAEIHYNMLFPHKYGLSMVLANFPEYDFQGDELTGSFKYPQFTKARFQELTSYVQSIGGIMVHPHPKLMMSSSDPMDYYVGEHMYLEIFHYNLHHNETIKNHDLWLELLALGKHVYASGGTDTHGDVSNEGVSTFYSREKSGRAFFDVMHSADFATGAVGMKMCICDGENCYPMGSEISYQDGMELHLRLDDFYEPAWEENTNYELRIFTDQGLAYVSSYNGKLPQAVSLKVQKRAFYRAEVYNKTYGYYVSVGNPIWLDK